ncbi:MAG: hypothetical protein ABS882_04855 [Lysinibacillus sp.]
MFSKPKVSKGEIIVSILLGVGASLISLFLLWNGIGMIDGEQKLLPVSDVVSEEVPYYATQHGVFSTKEAAAQFQKQYPTLNQSVIVQVGEGFHLWSSLHVTKTTEATVQTSFSKKVTMSGASCSDAVIAKLPKLLQDENLLKNNLEESDLPPDWTTTVTAITAMTTDVAEVRLLLFEHYRQQQSCLKLNFE